MDITQLILDDHAEQRRLFALLEEIDSADTASLTAVWKRLSTFLEVHAEAEAEEVEHEAKHAIKDHNKIRDAVAAVAGLTVGSEEWRAAVLKANEENGDHAAEEEREGLTSFRNVAPLDLRHELGVRFIAYEVRNVNGVVPVDKDPEEWVAAHG